MEETKDDQFDEGITVDQWFVEAIQIIVTPYLECGKT